MRRLLTFAGTALLLGAAGCSDEVYYPDDTPAAPTGLYYVLEPSGDPVSPRGVVLRWDWSDDPNLAVWHVYSRASTAEGFGLRGSTTSPSFHDDGVPHLEYYVTAESQLGYESAPSASVVVDERLRLPAPLTLTSVSLNGRIHLEWTDNAYQADPAGFSHYRVYSTPYDLDANLCGTAWTLEGTTVAATFLSGNLPNGMPRCFGVSAITIEGFESLWSPLRYDTPRPDGRAVAVFLPAADALQSGFRFFLDGNNDGLAGPLELGLVGNAASGNLDFVLQTGGAGQLQIVPQRATATVRQYGTGPLNDLTDIDIAPLGGYARTPLDATVRYGYVFEMTEPDGYYRYGAIRVIAVGTDYVVFDWSYQTDRGNPELLRNRER
jgi:hypothetical protein